MRLIGSFSFDPNATCLDQYNIIVDLILVFSGIEWVLRLSVLVQFMNSGSAKVESVHFISNSKRNCPCVIQIILVQVPLQPTIVVCLAAY